MSALLVNSLSLPATAFEPIQATGGDISDITVDGVTYRVHTFRNTGSTNFVVSSIGNSDGNVEYLIVAGGGSGGQRLSGGGGAGGVLSGNTTVTATTYAVVVGAGGAAAGAQALGNAGGNSSVFGQTAVGGGGGGGYNGSASVGGGSGGSGGGAASGGGVGGAGTAGQGNAGGTGNITNWDGDSGYSGGGGGGAGAAGTNGVGGGPVNGLPGAGGIGVASSITGTVRYYGGGGGGHQYRNQSIVAPGGVGGGGAGGFTGPYATTFAVPVAGTTNTGGGGGAGGYYANEGGASGAGGSGVVIIRYPVNLSAIQIAAPSYIASTGAPLQMLYFRTDERSQWSAPVGLAATQILPLGLTITPKRANSLIVMQWMINGEVHYNTLWEIYLNGQLINTPGYQGTNNAPSSPGRWSGYVAGVYDRGGDVNSTMENTFVQYSIVLNTTATMTFYPAIRGSGATAYTFNLNRTNGSVGQDSYENAISTGVIMEIAQ